MRIAFFAPHSDPLARAGEPDSGGQCIYEERVARQLAQRGHEVRVYNRQYADKLAREPIAPGAEVHRFHMGPEGFLRKEDMGPHLPAFVEAVLAAEGDWLAEADLCHGHYWDGGASALMASLALGRPVVFTSHSLGITKRERVPDPDPNGATYRYPVRIAAESRILAAADGVIALSEVERQTLTDQYGAPEEAIHIVPGGVDVDWYAPAADKRALKEQAGLDPDRVTLFTVGRLDPRKGFLELVEALPTARQARPDVPFQLLLPSGPAQRNDAEARYYQAMHERVEALGLSDVVAWFPRLDDDALRLRYQAADAFVCPSPYEPFGLVVIEAFAAGTPVIATPFGGPRVIVTEGQDGLLADPTDPDVLGQAIARFLALEPEQRQAMAQHARQTAESRYAWSAVAAQIEAAYAAICAAQRFGAATR